LAKKNFGLATPLFTARQVCSQGMGKRAIPPNFQNLVQFLIATASYKHFPPKTVQYQVPQSFRSPQRISAVFSPAAMLFFTAKLEPTQVSPNCSS